MIGMRNAALLNRMQENPVIAAVKQEERLSVALKSPAELIFLLTGNLFNLADLVAQSKQSGKNVFVHMDLLEGFSHDALSLRYIHERIQPDGIISTKPALVRAAADLGMETILRIFVMDSLSLQTAIKTALTAQPSAVEMLPGVMPKVINGLCRRLPVPLIAGGLITDKEDVIAALGAGAQGVSTTNEAIWAL